MAANDNEISSHFYHGTKANLQRGDLVAPGNGTGPGGSGPDGFIYLTATLDAAIWGAELAGGDGRGRIYTVEPTGPVDDAPNLTDTTFPGIPAKSYRTRDPLRIIGEITDWSGHSAEELTAMKGRRAELARLGIDTDDD